MASRKALCSLGLALAYLTSIQVALSQLSAPVSHDDHISIDGNKFLQNSAHLDKPGAPKASDEELPYDFCPQNVEMKWSTEVSSSIYATPLITDLYSDGRKDIIVPSFVHYLEVLEADNGAQSVGWPVFHHSTSHSSPLLVDIDMDGVQDILLTTYNGEVMFFKDNGERLPYDITIPRLQVKKYWFKELEPNLSSSPAPGGGADHHAAGLHTDTGSSPVHTPRPATEQVSHQLVVYRQRMQEYRDKFGTAALRQLLRETHSANPTFYGLLMDQLNKEGLVGKDGVVNLPRSSNSSSPKTVPSQQPVNQPVPQATVISPTTTTTPAIPATTSTPRRRLMQLSGAGKSGWGFGGDRGVLPGRSDDDPADPEPGPDVTPDEQDQQDDRRGLSDAGAGTGRRSLREAVAGVGGGVLGGVRQLLSSGRQAQLAVCVWLLRGCVLCACGGMGWV